MSNDSNKSTNSNPISESKSIAPISFTSSQTSPKRRGRPRKITNEEIKTIKQAEVIEDIEDERDDIEDENNEVEETEEIETKIKVIDIDNKNNKTKKGIKTEYENDTKDFTENTESYNPSIYLNSRRNYFDAIGTSIEGAKELDEAIKLAKLDFTVEKQRIFTKRELKPNEEHAGGSIFVPVPELYATVRTDNGVVLGTVKKNYHILQNSEAFDFLDSVIENGAKFEVAGTFKTESASFITCSTETIKILDDEITPYILFTNSFDGSASVRVAFTPIRVACSNCIVRAMKQATNKLAIRHSSSLKQKLESSKEILVANEEYLDALREESETWAVTPFSSSAFEALARSLYPIDKDSSDLIKARNERMFDSLMNAYRQDDLENFANTAYRAVQAVADFESHKPQIRKTRTADYANIKTIMTGMPLLNAVADRMNDLV